MSAELNTATVRYRIAAGVRNRTVTLPPLPPARFAGRRDGPAFDTPMTGTARVSFSIVLPGGRQVSRNPVTY